MKQETKRVLEYDKIRTMIAGFAGSVLGREEAEHLEPVSEFEEVYARLRQTTEAVTILSASAPPLGGIFDIRPALKKVSMGSVLDPDELVNIMSTMYAMRSVKHFFRDLALEAPILKEWARGIEILGQLERRLDNTIDEHGEIRETASVELQRIRREHRSAQSRIKERMNSALHNTEFQKYFQDAIITIRDNRYVIPVKQEYRSRFPGIVHDQSATGSTLFIEPMAVVELNNDVKQLSLAEQQEIQRILRAVSQEIGRNSAVLRENCAVLAQIDFTFAKAKLAESMNATCPQINEEGRTKLVKARHPLIAADRVVPIDIYLGDGYRMLLVTGPNTGGKTVSMKTLGLLVLMAQSGCYLPVDQGSEISVYRNVYVDIGDEQSIEQSLSTFSAHMKNIVSILQVVEAEDLLLLDELGAGTDPEEGAALAMSILEQILQVGASTMATTHYSDLKTFAYTREGIENACVEFDVKTLRPTYRLLIGTPGASNAFAISKRLGLPQSVILRAQQLVREDHAQFEHVINALENEKMMYEQRNADIQERQQRVTQMELRIREMKDELAKKKGEMIRKAREQSAAMVRRTRRESEEIIEKLKEQYDDQGVRRRQQAIQEARQKLNEAYANSRPGIMAEKGVGKPLDLKSLQVGDIVYVKTLAEKGAVVEIRGKEITVQLGGLRSKVKASSCTFVSHAEKDKPTGSAGRNPHARSLMQKTASVHREIDVRGLMVNEAEVVIGKFIDDAMLAGLREVLIIHGKGTGALRKGLHEYLKRHRNVVNFRFADLTEGGYGATVVELK